MLPKNIVPGDATVRALLGVVLAIAALDIIVGLAGQSRFWIAAAVGIVSLTLITTASLSFCPLCYAFGRRTDVAEGIA